MNKKQSAPVLIAIRIRGEPNMRSDIMLALESLRLNRVHTAALLRADPEVLGTLHKVKDVVVWGEVQEPTVVELLKKRAKMKGGGTLSEDFIKKKLKLSDFGALARAILNGDLRLKDIPGLIPYFRLAPPSRGYMLKTERVKRGKREITGYAGTAINEFTLRMV